MFALLTAVTLLAAEPAAAAAPAKKPLLKLASPGLRSVNLAPELGTFWADQLSQELSLAGAKMTTTAELQALLGIERQKQLLGCSDEGGSCMAELAGALGVDALVTGTIAKVGELFQVNVKVLDAANGNTLSTASATADGDKELLQELRRLARAVCNELFAKLDRAPDVSNASKVLDGGTVRKLFWLPAAVGVVALGASLGLWLYADSLYRQLIDMNTTVLLPNNTVSAGKTADLLSVVMLSVGAAALATSALMYAFGGPKQVELYVAPVAGSSGAGVVFGASLP